MLKLLFTGMILYLLYKVFFNTPALKKGNSEDPTETETGYQKQNEDEGEYIDYEEVD